MDSKEDKFEITWEDLKYLIERAQASVNSEISNLNTIEGKEQLIAPINKIKKKFDYDARIQRDRTEKVKDL